MSTPALLAEHTDAESNRSISGAADDILTTRTQTNDALPRASRKIGSRPPPRGLVMSEEEPTLSDVEALGGTAVSW